MVIFVKHFNKIIMSSNKILNALGILMIFGVIILIFKFIIKKTETKLYSDDAMKVLQDENNLKKLEDVVSDYQKSGKWSKVEIN